MEYNSSCMRILGLHHIALQVYNLEKVAHFYREVLQLPEMTRHFRPDGTLRSIWMKLSGQPEQQGFLAIEQADTPSSITSGPAGYSFLALGIDRDDRRHVEERLRSLGVPVEHASRWTLYFRDPEGNRVGLSHYPQDTL